MGKTFREYCVANRACEEGLAWLGDRTPAQFWADCDRPDWFLWVPLPTLGNQKRECQTIVNNRFSEDPIPAHFVDVDIVSAGKAVDRLFDRMETHRKAILEWEAGRLTSGELQAKREEYLIATGHPKHWRTQLKEELLFSFREVITLKTFLAACRAEGIET